MTTNLQNWSGHHTFSAARLHRPASMDELREVVRRSEKAKVIGARHSFNHLADTTGDLISLENMPPVLALDKARSRVTVDAGVTYGALCAKLHEAGVAIHNMASLPHITVAGAVATATHGSGDANGNLATAVAALEVVTADGEVVEFARERDAEEFEGAVVGLGALGVVSKVTLAVSPAFSMRQEIYDDMPAEQVLAHFDAIMGSAYSVSLFWDWKPRVNQVWLKERAGDGSALPAPAQVFYEATLAPAPRHPVLVLPAAPCTEQMGVMGPWHERLPHFRVDHTPASGDELQTEFFVGRENAVAAIEALMRHEPEMAPHLWITEVRSVAEDRLWLSPSYGRPTVGIHFSWKKRWAEVKPLVEMVERELAPFAVRPHWGKIFTMEAEQVQAQYPKMGEFRVLARKYDPTGKFRNAFVEEYIFGE